MSCGYISYGSQVCCENIARLSHGTILSSILHDYKISVLAKYARNLCENRTTVKKCNKEMRKSDKKANSNFSGQTLFDRAHNWSLLSCSDTLSLGIRTCHVGSEWPTKPSPKCTQINDILGHIRPLIQIFKNRRGVEVGGGGFSEQWYFHHCFGRINCKYVRIQAPPRSNSV
jgi:hypothetical protein